MLTRKQFEAMLCTEEVLVLDGALASELEVRGHDLNHVLWSAKILKHDPAAIEKVHTDYFVAGAHIAITSSYQAAPQGLYDHFGMHEDCAKDLIRTSVRLARSARDAAYSRGVDAIRPLLVAGSVGPFGAYLSDGSEYRGDYTRTTDEFKDFHRPRIQALIEAGVDLLALETMPNISEIRSLLKLLRSDFPDALAWLSCTAKSVDRLSDGTTWETLLDLVNKYDDQIIAFGINCVPLSMASSSLEQIHRFTRLPLVCYPNSGELWDAETKSWYGESVDAELRIHSRSTDIRYQTPSDPCDWIKNGARLVGGCCRTGPAFIAATSNKVEKISTARVLAGARLASGVNS